MAAKAAQSEVVKRALAMLHSRAEPEAKAVQDDPVLDPGQWYPEFHRLHMQAVHETPDFDYAWVRRNRPELYREIKAIEDRIDTLQQARLSEIVGIITQWRELVLRAFFEQQANERKQQEDEANRPRPKARSSILGHPEAKFDERNTRNPGKCP